MTTVEQNIVNTYARLFENLSKFARLELIERITLSLKEEDRAHKEDKNFFNLFGAFPDDKTAEEMVTEIKSSRQFREKDLTI